MLTHQRVLNPWDRTGTSAKSGMCSKYHIESERQLKKVNDDNKTNLDFIAEEMHIW